MTGSMSGRRQMTEARRAGLAALVKPDGRGHSLQDTAEAVRRVGTLAETCSFFREYPAPGLGDPLPRPG